MLGPWHQLQEATVHASLGATLHLSLVRPSEKDRDLGRLPRTTMSARAHVFFRYTRDFPPLP
jgi:hypothetical protein